MMLQIFYAAYGLVRDLIVFYITKINEHVLRKLSLILIQKTKTTIFLYLKNF